MKRRFVLAAAAALTIGLTACGGGGGNGGVLAPHPGVPSSASDIPPQLLIANYGQGAMNGAMYVGPASNEHLDAMVLVHQQNAQALVQYAQDVSDPSSPNFRQFLTPDQIAQRFGASQSDYLAAAQYFAKNGLAVAGWRQRLVLTVAGSQSSMEKAFGTTFGWYEKGGQKFLAPMTPPHFAQVVPVDEVGNIVRYHASHTYMIPGPRAGEGFTTGYTPQTIRAAFDYTGAIAAGFDGTGITIGIIGTGPIDSYNGGHGDHDLDAFLAATHSTGANVTQVDVTNTAVTGGLAKSKITGFPYAGDFQVPPPVTASCRGSLPACNPEDGEAQLDTQQAATLAPGSNVYFYLAYNAADCSTVTFPNQCSGTTGSPAIGINESDPEIQQVINDDKADVVSMSFGLGDTQAFAASSDYTNSYSQLEFAELNIEGIAAFASSGDDGSAECFNGVLYEAQQCVSYPAGDPNVTSVGGVTADVDGAGQPTAPWLAWGISTSDSGYGGQQGSGGGTSTVITAPSWQKTLLGATMREQPDVSLDGDPSTGVAVTQNARFGAGGIGDIGGTSVAAPEMAAMWADVLSACAKHPGDGMCPSGASPRMGNAAPYLYAIYKHTSVNGLTPALTYAQVFYDIVYGDNQMTNPNGTPSSPIPGFQAGPGYDEVSGVGVPYAGHLIEALTGGLVPVL